MDIYQQVHGDFDGFGEIVRAKAVMIIDNDLKGHGSTPDSVEKLRYERIGYDMVNEIIARKHFALETLFTPEKGNNLPSGVLEICLDTVQML